MQLHSCGLRRKTVKTDLPDECISGCRNASDRKLVSDNIHTIARRSWS